MNIWIITISIPLVVAALLFCTYLDYTTYKELRTTKIGVYKVAKAMALFDIVCAIGFTLFYVWYLYSEF